MKNTTSELTWKNVFYNGHKTWPSIYDLMYQVAASGYEYFTWLDGLVYTYSHDRLKGFLLEETTFKAEDIKE